MAESNYKINIKTTSDTQGAEEITEAIAVLDKTAAVAEKGSKDLAKVIDKLDDESEDAAKALKKEADALDDLARSARKATKTSDDFASSNKKVVGANTKVKKSNKNSALGFLEVSRAVEDAQYGLNGVLNNLPQIALNFGLGAGLAGAVSLAAVGLFTLVPLLGGTKEGIDGLKESVGAMGDAFKDVGDMTELDNQFNALTKSINEQSEAIDLNSERFAKNVKARQEARKIKLQEQALIAEVRKQEIDDSDLSEADKIHEKGKIDIKLSRLRGADDLKVEEERLSLLQQQKDALAERASLLDQRVESAKSQDVDAEIELAKAQLRSARSVGTEAAIDLEDADFTMGSMSDKLGLLPGGQDVLAKMTELNNEMDLAGDDVEARLEVMKNVVAYSQKVRAERKASEGADFVFGEDGDNAELDENLFNIAADMKKFITAESVQTASRNKIESLEKIKTDSAATLESAPTERSNLEESMRDVLRDIGVQELKVNSLAKQQPIKQKLQTNDVDKGVQAARKKAADAEDNQRKKEEQDAAREAKQLADAQRATSSAELAAVSPAKSALAAASKVPGVSQSKINARINKAETAVADGANSNELAEANAIIERILSVLERKGQGETAVANTLINHNAKLEALIAKQNQQTAKLKQMQMQASNNRGKR